jgi:hypothetical protein
MLAILGSFSVFSYEKNPRQAKQEVALELVWSPCRHCGSIVINLNSKTSAAEVVDDKAK